MKIIEKLNYDYFSPDGLWETTYSPEEDEESRQRQEDKAMEGED